MSPRWLLARKEVTIRAQKKLPKLHKSTCQPDTYKSDAADVAAGRRMTHLPERIDAFLPILIIDRRYDASFPQATSLWLRILT